MWTPQAAWTNSIKNTAICSNVRFDLCPQRQPENGGTRFQAAFFVATCDWLQPTKTRFAPPQSVFAFSGCPDLIA
ncbi:hypothetical protein GCWU000324_02844 [Kingella oralis ATCC 51147]|uniref:Uncharacterized protein n=1 Tax=Kingella oralis ATCC 51147 TaxID=629741 RepID=C4GMB1_9NEIS|nr:hypothetical protein GCWU000324_02844 [Kingella oralis ATCC 51147]